MIKPFQPWYIEELGIHRVFSIHHTPLEQSRMFMWSQRVSRFQPQRTPAVQLDPLRLQQIFYYFRHRQSNLQQNVKNQRKIINSECKVIIIIITNNNYTVFMVDYMFHLFFFFPFISLISLCFILYFINMSTIINAWKIHNFVHSLSIYYSWHS